MAISMYVGLELNDSFAKKTSRRALEKRFVIDDPYFEGQRPDVISRFLGHSISGNPLVRQVWRAVQSNEKRWPAELRSVKLYQLRGNLNSVLVLHVELEDGDYQKTVPYRKLKSQNIREAVALFNFEDLLQIDRAVYAVAGTLVPESDPWEPLTRDGWIHLKGDYVQGRLVEQLVTRAAIERSLLGWAAWKGEGSKFRFLLPAIALFRIRLWPVQLLVDRTEISSSYLCLRESMNLPNVRAELMDQGKTWWSVATGLAGGIAVGLALVALWL